MDLVDGFCVLFQGRHEAVGTEEGGCLRQPTLDDRSPAMWWRDMVHSHLHTPGAAIGVYPMALVGDTWSVHWGCVDFDEGWDDIQHGINLQRVLHQFGITGHLERSRSKGWHVWVFATQWVPAVLMREALLAACQIVDAPTREINPKQESLAWDPQHKDWALGNYVRLPYPCGWDNSDVGYHRTAWGGALESDTRWGGMEARAFVELAMDTRCDSQQLWALATLYEPPPKPQRPEVEIDLDRPVLRRLNGLAYTKYTKGPLDENPDRSAWLYGLACDLAESEVTYTEALAILKEAHDKWAPKWIDRPDGGHRQLDQMISKVMP